MRSDPSFRFLLPISTTARWHVIAMADWTGAPGQTLEEFKASLGDRLVALARAQGLLSRAAPGEGVTFDSLLDSEVSAHSEDGGTVTLDGPLGIVLNSISVQALAMAFARIDDECSETWGAWPQGRASQRQLASAGRERVALDFCRLEGRRRRHRSTKRAAGGWQWSAPYRGRLALSVRSSDNLRDRAGRRPQHDRASALRT